MAEEKSGVLLQNSGEKDAPIIIVPGLAVFLAGENWKKILEQSGHAARIANLYSVLSTSPIDYQARRLFLEIEKILSLLEAAKCHLLAFSMGGITALHFLKKYNIRDRILKCICVAAPFNGIPEYLDALAPFKAIVRGLPEIMRGNELLAELSEKENAPPIQIFTIRGKKDLLCGEKSGYLPFANNLPPANGGHIAICCGLNKQAIKQVLAILAI